MKIKNMKTMKYIQSRWLKAFKMHPSNRFMVIRIEPLGNAIK